MALYPDCALESCGNAEETVDVQLESLGCGAREIFHPHSSLR